MAEPVLIIETNWKLVPTSCEPCRGCGDIIYGKQYQLHLQRIGETDVILCESCYTVVISPED